MKCLTEQNNKTGASSPGYSDRKMGNIGTASESNPVTAHEIFNTITLAEGIKYIGGNAFAFNDHVSEINLPNSIEIIYDNAFMGTKIKSLKIPGKVENIAFALFSGCSSLESITLGEGITSIGKYAFAFCKSLEEIILPSTLEVIDETAFQGCAGLTDIVIPESVTYIGKGAFHRCEGLETITFYTRDTQLGYNLFLECDVENLIIYGYEGSTIEAYANEYGLNFYSIDGLN